MSKVKLSELTNTEISVQPNLCKRLRELEAFEAENERLKANSGIQWISTKDRLPEERKKYLTINTEFEVKIQPYDVLWYDDDKDMDGHLGFRLGGVTHWAEINLPE